MQKVKLVYNPLSGTNGILDHLDDVIHTYQQKGFLILPYRLTFDSIDDEFICDHETDLHHILIAGGDGTINYVVNILKNNDIKTPIAILPTGTANDFASMLEIPENITNACRQILNGEIRNIDLGKANNNYFVNVFSCGLFTDVSQRTPTMLKNVFGKLAYYFSGLQELPNFRKLTINLHAEEQCYEGSSLIFFVFNGQTAGKMRIAYLSDVQDGLLDVLVVKSDMVSTLTAMGHFLRRGGTSYPAGILHFKTNHLYIDSLNNEITDIDGQPGPQFPVEITCEQEAIQILCPIKVPTPHKSHTRTKTTK